MLALGIGFIYVKNTQTAESLYQSGQIYKGLKQPSRDSDYAVKIVATTPALGSDDNTNFFIVRTEDDAFIVLEVDKKDTRFKEGEVNIFDEPLLLATRTDKWNNESSLKWKNAVKSTDFANKFESTYLLSITSFESATLWGNVIGAVLSVVGVGVVYLAFKRRSDNQKSFDNLIAVYPELADDFTLLQTDGLYVNDVSRLYIYKNHLIVMTGAFDIVDLTEVTWLGLEVVVGRYNMKTASLVYFLNEVAKKQVINVGKYGKKHSGSIDELFVMIATHFSHINLGEEKSPEYSGKRKTISEFLAQQQANTTTKVGETIENESASTQEAVVLENEEETVVVENDEQL